MHAFSLKHLSDAALTQELKAAVSLERHALASLLAHIAEFDARELYLPAGCSSMYRYCVDRLRLSEDAAAKRIQVARLGRDFPVVFAAVADGRLHLSGLGLLAQHVTRANGDELLADAMGLSKARVELLIAERFPSVPAAFAAFASNDAQAYPCADLSTARLDVAPAMGQICSPGEEPVPAPGRVLAPASDSNPVPVPVPVPAPQARMRPIAPGRFELVALIDQETHDQLMQSRDLLGHVVTSNHLSNVIARAIRVQHAQLLKRRCAATDRPRANADEARALRALSNPRRIPAATVRVVWKRDGGRCTFVGTDGHRCEERSRLQIDHVPAVAQGGEATADKLRLCCSAHNQYAAEQALGRDLMNARRTAAQRRRGAERYFKQRERERTEQRKAEIERQREELGEGFRLLGYRGADLERALAYCATKPEASAEERVKYALGNMAPKARKEFPAQGERAPTASSEVA